VRYWKDYTTRIAGLPAEFRENGALATLVLRVSDFELRDFGKSPKPDMIADLKWVDEKGELSVMDWVSDVFREEGAVAQMARTLSLMTSAQILKSISQIRRKLAEFDKRLVDETPDVIGVTKGPDEEFSSAIDDAKAVDDRDSEGE